MLNSCRQGRTSTTYIGAAATRGARSRNLSKTVLGGQRYHGLLKINNSRTKLCRLRTTPAQSRTTTHVRRWSFQLRSLTEQLCRQSVRRTQQTSQFDNKSPVVRQALELRSRRKATARATHRRQVSNCQRLPAISAVRTSDTCCRPTVAWWKPRSFRPAPDLVAEAGPGWPRAVS